MRPARRDAGALVLVFAVTYLLAAAISYPVTRERLPAMAALLLFTGPAVMALVSAARERRWRALAGWMAALGIAVVVVHWRIPDGGHTRQEAWMTEISRGDALSQLWDREQQPPQLAGAIAAYESALRIRPEALQPLKQLPPMLWRADRRDDALAVQERLTARLRSEYPRNVTVRARELEMAGNLAMRAGHPARAEAAAREWYALGIQPLAALDLTAVALAAQGKRSEALAVAEERARRAPGDPEADRLLQTIRDARPGG
jgi:tetratricopeptide (TPR) repeat protein